MGVTGVGRLGPDALAKRPKRPRPASMTEEWQRQHFFEALVRALLNARQPLLLLLDDLQWCDNETLEWLHYLLRFEPGVRLLLTGTEQTRSEEHTSELQSHLNLVCRLLLEKKKKKKEMCWIV